jgi:hypothetical protein
MALLLNANLAEVEAGLNLSILNDIYGMGRMKVKNLSKLCFCPVLLIRGYGHGKFFSIKLYIFLKSVGKGKKYMWCKGNKTTGTFP